MNGKIAETNNVNLPLKWKIGILEKWNTGIVLLLDYTTISVILTGSPAFLILPGSGLSGFQWVFYSCKQ
jgi:hypothetical protein